MADTKHLANIIYLLLLFLFSEARQKHGKSTVKSVGEENAKASDKQKKDADFHKPTSPQS